MLEFTWRLRRLIMITGMQCRKANREKLGLERKSNLHFKQQHHHYPITAYRHDNSYSATIIFNCVHVHLL